MLNVLDIITQRGLVPKRNGNTNGGEFVSACPWCGDGGKGRKSDRFHVWPQKIAGGKYWCRQCGRSGDVIQMLRDLEGKTFQEACELSGRDLPSRVPYRAPRIRRNSAAGISDDWSPADPPELSPLWQKKAEAFVGWAFDNLMKEKPVMAWLNKRGIDEFIAKCFHLGWNPTDLFRPRSAWGLLDELKDNGRKKRLWLPAGLVIPMRRNGRVRRVRVRRPEGTPRYYMIPGSDPGPMLDFSPGQQGLVVVESELDLMTLSRMAPPIMGLMALGASSIRPDAVCYPVVRQAARILVSLDADAAGAKASRWWLDRFPAARRWPVPDGKDPGEAYAAGIDLEAWVLAGLPAAWTMGD